MKLNIETIKRISNLIVTSDNIPYLRKIDLIDYINETGIFNDTEKSVEHLSRERYLKDRLLKMNDSDKIQSVLAALISEERYSNTDYNRITFIDELNDQLRLSDFTVLFNGRNTTFQSIKVKPSKEEIEAHFEDNRKTVINCIRDAKYLVWVAVAWFTDEIIYRELITKKNSGVNVQVIMLDDAINNNSGLVFRKKIEAYKVKPYGNYENIMHEKFCIIDLEKVIYGSYNWTNKAQYNDEHITVDSHHKSVQRFADEFIRLKERELSKK